MATQTALPHGPIVNYVRGFHGCSSLRWPEWADPDPLDLAEERTGVLTPTSLREAGGER